MKANLFGASGRARRTRRSVVSFFATLAVVATSSLAVTVTAATANAASPGDGTGYTLEGCRNNGGITLPNAGGQFICPDAAYTTGNLGKGWNELDLVPGRVTLSAGNSAPSSQTVTFAIVVDREDASRPGYDVLSAPTLNTGLSSATGCTSFSSTAETLAVPGLGSADKSLYRLVTVSNLPDNTDCVFDFYARLALGSHLYPGASLHFNLGNEQLGTAGIGSKEVSIPVNEIKPQELTKDMSATQGSDHVWDIVKSPTPTTVRFTDTCTGAPSYSLPASVTVTWTKQPATPSGDITVVTHVYAKNPASRIITVSVSDQIRSGTTAIGAPITSGPVDVPANTTQLVLTHQTTVPAGTTNLNDVATATYTDKVTGVAVPGTTTATASAAVQLSGPELNQSAVITDTESITGAGLSFSSDSFSGASGSFDGGYIAGTPTTGPVSWTSATQSSSGSVTFNKTIYSTSASVSSGQLSDVATVTGSDGFTATANASIDISTQASGRITVSKTASLSIAQALTFTFHLLKGGVGTGDTATVNLPAGSTGPVSSNTISNLAVIGSYAFHEDATAPYAAQNTAAQSFALVPGDPSTCALTFTVTNSAPAATARVKKDTVPTSSGNWTFTLTGPGGLSETLTNVAAGSGYAAFASTLTSDGGTYTITETQQAGYDLTGLTGDFGGSAARVTTDKAARTCSFTLDLTTDSGKVLSCAYVNTLRGRIVIKKLTDPSGSTQSFPFTTSYSAGFSLTDGQTNTSGLLVPGTYSAAENTPTGWDLTGASCDDGSAVGAIGLQAGETVTCTFTNTQRGRIIIVKQTDPDGSTQQFTFDPSYAADFQLRDGESNDSGFLQPGDYSVSETEPTGWDLTSATCSDGSKVDAIHLQSGEVVTCTFTNRQRGSIIVKKVTQPSTSTQQFAFTGDAAGTIGNGETITVGNLVPGTYASTESVVSGWDLLSIVCDDAGSATASSGSLPLAKATFRLDAGETVMCTFTNRERGHVRLVKTVDGAAPSGTQAFIFQLRQGASAVAVGTTVESGVANAGNGGNVSFATNLVPGQTYQFCEIVMPGWTSTLGTFVPDSFIPPDGATPNPNVDNSIVCVNFSVGAGETKTFTVVNSPPPGGRALTIGFWKNWASCASSKGGQKPVLDQVLATFPIASGKSTHGVYVGALYVDTCSEAVALLNKSTLSGKKMSSDPLFNMAAQLMAAVLNFQAGSGKCAAAITAVNQAQTLLGKYTFTGNGYSPKLTTADASLANQLATTLDRYNNNLLC